MKKLRAIDLCCGAGGWSVAAKDLPVQILEAFDFAEDCCATHRYNFPDTQIHCIDVRKIQWSKFKHVDVVLGAIPCEEISVARANFKADTEIMRDWHELLDSMLDGINQIRPRFWAIENVMQMRKHLPPLTPQWIADASLWSGQARKRMFVGNFPVPRSTNDRTVLSDYLRPGPFIIRQNTLECTKISRRQWYEKDTKRVIDPKRKSVTITDFGSRHSRGFCVPMENGKERSLQFVEAAAIQGFPGDYVFVTSQSRAWKMVAQAIPIPVGRAILEAICKECFA